MQAFIGVLLGGGILTFVQFLITRHDKRKDELGDIKKAIDALKTEIDKIDKKSDRRDAENRRVRILRFEDELQRGLQHSKDSFDQVLEDITWYTRYCDKDPEFKNDQTAATIEHIHKVYHERLERRDFL